MYISKDDDYVPTFESRWIHWVWTPAQQQDIWVMVTKIGIASTHPWPQNINLKKSLCIKKPSEKPTIPGESWQQVGEAQ